MDEWSLTFRGYQPDDEGLREALCTLGNGYVGTRGAAAEASADGVHYPGTYVAGVYNRLTTEIEGREIENESIVNVANWLPLTFSIDGGRRRRRRRRGPRPRADPRDAAGCAHQTVPLLGRLRTETSVSQQRLVHMDQAHLMAIQMAIRPENWCGPVTIRSGLDGRVRNRGVERYGIWPTTTWR